MGHRTTQRILECGECGRTPDDGEYMWEMCGEYICVSCINKDECECDNLGGECHSCEVEL